MFTASHRSTATVDHDSNQAVVEYYVLKHGRTQGPLTKAEVLDKLTNGLFTSEDLGQIGDARHWTPLRRLFEEAPAPGVRLRLPGRDGREKASTPVSDKPQSFSTEALAVWEHAMSGVQNLFLKYPFETGLVCAALGCVLLLLSYARIFIIGPVLVGGLLGGGVTMLRGRVLPGMLLCAATVFLPALIWAAFLWAGQWVALPR